jgi:hypothetical protein
MILLHRQGTLKAFRIIIPEPPARLFMIAALIACLKSLVPLTLLLNLAY